MPLVLPTLPSARLLLLIVLVLAALPAASARTAAPDTLATARGHLLAQRGEEAWQLLAPLLGELAGTPAFDHLFGVAALETARPVEAIFAFERVLDVEPGNSEARAYLARALFEAGENDSARAEFERVREGAAAGAMAADVERYLSAIGRRLDRDATRYALFFETAAGYDSNVASATDERFIAVPALGGVLVELASSSRAEGSALWRVGGGGNFSTPLGRDWSLLGGASLQHRLPTSESDFRQFTANGDLGLEWRVDGDDTLRLGAAAQRFDVGGEPNRELGGITAQWQRNLDQRTQVTLFGQFAALRFPDQDLRDVDRYTGGLGFGHAFAGPGTPLLVASVYGGREDATHVAAERVSRSLVGTRLSGQYRIDARLAAFAALTYQYSDYDGVEPAFLRARSEHFVDLALGLRVRLAGGWSLSPQLSYARNDANLPLFEYDRWETQLTLRNDF